MYCYLILVLKNRKAAEPGTGALGNVVVEGHLGPLFECRRHFKTSGGSHLSIAVMATIVELCNSMVEVKA